MKNVFKNENIFNRIIILVLYLPVSYACVCVCARHVHQGYNESRYNEQFLLVP